MKLIKIVLVCVLAFMIVACEKISGDNLGATTPPAPPILQSISAKLAAGKEMLVGNEFDKTKVVVTATYDDGSSQTVASGNWNWQATVGSFDKTNTTTAQTVKITYGDKETNLDVTVAEYKKFVVVGVWGQSNAVGYDESPIIDDDTPKFPYRVKQIPADNNAISNLTACARNYQDMNQPYKGGGSFTSATYGGSTEAFLNGRKDKAGNTRIGTKGIHLPLGELISGAIPEDYGVLIVPYAAGGKKIDFFNAQSYYTAFVNKIKVALNTHADSKLAGIIWCQGEHNAGNTTASSYKTQFESLVSNVNTLLESEKSKTVNNKVDWFFYEFPKYFRNTGSGENSGQSIMGAIKQVLGETHYTSIDENHPVNETTYTTSTKAAHYGQNYYRTHIAPAVFATMKNAGAFKITK